MTTESNAQEEAKKLWEAADAAESSGQTLEFEPRTEEQTEQSVREDQGNQVPQEVKEELMDDPQLLRDKIAGLESVIQQFSGRLRNAEGHIGGLNSQLKQRVEAAKQVDAAGGNAPTAREITAATNDPEAFAELERDYPEFARAVKAPLDSMRNQLAELQTKNSQQTKPSDPQEYKRELAALRSEMTVEMKHAGWLETVAKPEFTGWLEQAPREVQMLANSDRPADAIRVLDLYSTARNSGTKTNQRLQSAAALPTGQRVTARTKNVDDMTPQEYWRYLDDVDKQKV